MFDIDNDCDRETLSPRHLAVWCLIILAVLAFWGVAIGLAIQFATKQ